MSWVTNNNELQYLFQEGAFSLSFFQDGAE